MGKISLGTSKMGISFVIIQLFLSVLVLTLSQFINSTCDTFCVGSIHDVFFFIINIPGWLFWGTFYDQLFSTLKPQESLLSGNLYITDYLIIFIFSSIVYYLLGMIIGKFLRKGKAQTVAITRKK